jgi:hypothetical protein
MNQRQREDLWIALSDLWLDTELSDQQLRDIAEVVRKSECSEAEFRDIFRFELAPFLGPNQRAPAGEWGGFDPKWVIQQARRRQGKRPIWTRITTAIGTSNYAAHPTYKQIEKLAFPPRSDTKSHENAE